MERSTSSTNGIVVEFTRPSDFHQLDHWDDWCRTVHLPTASELSGAWVATRWEIGDRPDGYSPPVGFTHVTIFEFYDIERGAPLLLHHLDQGRSDGSLHRVHTITAVDVFEPTGNRWFGRATPTDALTGQVIAYVGPNDPLLTREWSQWLDEVHIPDMVASGAFVDASRWIRTHPSRFGPNYLTIYDVELDDVAVAVALSGRAMGPAHAQGRVLPSHAGGIRAALHAAGRYPAIDTGDVAPAAG